MTMALERGLDLPPEYCHYHDEGCEFALSCLDCPFPKCLYEEPRGKQQFAKAIRDTEVSRLFVIEGKGINELSLMFGISPRTVRRIIKRLRNE